MTLSITRRGFLKNSAATLATTAIVANAHAAGSDVLRIGLIGCGGRGTGAAAQALHADSNVKLTTMGDAFEDRLQFSLASLKKDPAIADKIDVKPEQCFVGFDAYKQVIANVDVVLLTAPPHFRPLHLQAAVDAGKHVFAEKPVAVDAPGVRKVLEICEQARKKNLSIVSGLCLRYDRGFQETMLRIHDGVIGDVTAIQANDLRGPIWVKPRQPDWTDMHWQMRNWYYFTWLSGDFNVEQHVHFLDVAAWIMKDTYPVKAVGMGGRQQRTGPEFGNIYDHHSVVYEYAGGTKLFAWCRQQPRCKNEISAAVMGSKGTGLINENKDGLRLTGHKGDALWRYQGQHKNMYQVEHDLLFAAIRNGKPINNGEYMSKSTLLAIMGRMATYTGQTITWDMALNSKEDLTPPKYEWGPIATPEIAVPGKTKFV